MADTSRDTLAGVIDEFLARLRKEPASNVFAEFVDLELTLTQMRVLFLLGGDRPTRPVGEVAVQLGVSVATAGRTVDRLVRLELADRREDPDDRRSKLVSLTDAGAALVGTKREHMRGCIREFCRGLPPAVGEELRRAMRAAVEVPPHAASIPTPISAPSSESAGASCAPAQIRIRS